VSASNGTLPANLIVERHEGGRLVELDSQGNTYLWGHFQVYQAPFRVLIAWHVGEAPDQATYIEVVFGMETNGSTAAVLTHGGWEALGEDSELKRAQYDSGWDEVFGQSFFKACEEGAKEPAPVFEPKQQPPKAKKNTGRLWNKSRKGSLADTGHMVH
jgi:hypothetical protein